jgi:hypothetical protein
MPHRVTPRPNTEWAWFTLTVSPVTAAPCMVSQRSATTKWLTWISTFLLWGHDHSRKETETVGNITHVNLGSMARAAFSYDEKDRPVVATILSFAQDGIRYKEKDIPVKPLEVVFVHADKGVERAGKAE